jgi:hypothetical protein
VILTRARVNTKGWPGLEDGLLLLRTLLERQWATMHPQLDPEDELDPTQRLNILASLGAREGIVRDLYNAQLLVLPPPSDPISLGDLSAEDDAREDTLSDASVLHGGAILAAAEHLTAIETVLLNVTGRNTAAMRVPLTEAIEFAMKQLEANMPRNHMVVTLAVDMLQKNQTDFDPELISEVPELHRLLERRAKLKKLIDEVAIQEALARPLSVDDSPAESAGDFEPAFDDETLIVQTNPFGLPRDADPNPPVDEDAQFTVYRPRQVTPDRWHTLLVFAHLDTPAIIREVEQQAHSELQGSADEYQALTADSSEAIPYGSEITLVPEITGMQFNPPIRSFLWMESIHRESFRMRPEQVQEGQRLRGRVSVYMGSILIAEIAMSVRVTDPAQLCEDAMNLDRSRARRFRHIFPSYSHKDTAIVEQFEQYARSLGDDYLRDVTTLRAGEVWDERLSELIEQADVFQLFWSRSSMISPFVRSEWERALALDRPDFIRPVYWEKPMPSVPEKELPPPALSRLQFQRIPAITHFQPV